MSGGQGKDSHKPVNRLRIARISQNKERLDPVSSTVRTMTNHKGKKRKVQKKLGDKEAKGQKTKGQKAHKLLKYNHPVHQISLYQISTKSRA